MEQTNKLEQTLDKVMLVITAGLAFFMPLFFLPTTSEFFEFNKLTLLTLATFVLLLIWSAKMITAKKVNIVRSKMTLPLVIFLIVFVLSAVFSLNPTISIYGKYGRWFPSVFAMVTLVFFYYVIAVNLKKDTAVKAVLNSLAAGATLSSLIGLFSYAGIYLGQSIYLQRANFTPTGSTATTAILASVAIIISLNYLFQSKLLPTKILYLLTIVLNFIAVALFAIPASFAVLIVGLVLSFIALDQKTVKKNSPFVIVITAISVVILLITALPQTKSFINNEAFGNELSLGVANSWKVSANSVTDYPLLGSGPSTFDLNFTRYRPLALNSTNLWNVRFDKPHNQLFEVIGTMGLVGIAAAIYFVVVALKLALSPKIKSESNVELKATRSLVGILVIALLGAALFTYTTVLGAFVFFLLLALLVSQTGEHATLSLSALNSVSTVSSLSDSKTSREILQFVALVPIAAYIIFWGWFMYKQYSSEVYVRRAIVAAQNNQGNETYTNLKNAVRKDARREQYHNTLAQTNIALATNIAAAGEDLSEEQLNLVRSLISEAIGTTRISTEVLNPLSAASWEIRAQVYRALMGVAQDANQWALRSYNTAIQLDPTNPRLRLEAGGIYYAAEDYLSAANLFRQAANLKPDYANAHYNLAQALIKLEQYGLAQRELQATLTLVQEGTPDYDKVNQELAQITELAETQAAARPTVQQLETTQNTENAQPQEQEPLTSPDEIETINEEVVVEENILEEVQDAVNQQNEEPEANP